MKSDEERLIRLALSQGWRVEKTRKSHVKFIPPDVNMQMVISSGTASDRRAFRNLMSDLRRSGLEFA